MASQKGEGSEFRQEGGAITYRNMPSNVQGRFRYYILSGIEYAIRGIRRLTDLVSHCKGERKEPDLVGRARFGGATRRARRGKGFETGKLSGPIPLQKPGRTELETD